MKLNSCIERWGLAGVFVACFLSSTLLPGVSEVVIVSLLAAGLYKVWPLFAVATIGNWLGSVVTYLTGYWSSEWLMSLLGFEQGVPDNVRLWVEDYGCLCGLLVWVPGIGDFLALGLGLAKTSVALTLVAILIGKAARYAVLLGLTKVVKDAISNFINVRKSKHKQQEECTTT